MHEMLMDKLALVTGGSRGIGRHIAAALHSAGCKVVITGRHPQTLEAAAKEIGTNCVPIPCDQRDAGRIDAMAQSVLTSHGPPDILVNNAGLYRGSPVADMTLEAWNEVIETNLTGVFLTTRAFLPGMIARGRGDIFMISSMSGKKGDPGTSAYNASKFGLQGFSQALLYEVRRHNIRVMVLNPSSVDTGPDQGPKHGKGLHLHAADLAALVVHLACMPGRTLPRDMDIWGTNP
ncbi:MAG: SDR family NAD(P)-dependent oxidoreductase [Candidatus Omnitrophica bacterium]|nr:3-phenylpropionate-dihydrodiol/cinnamic acid-dihydrodiol dehydrogenase [bacterium]NUN96279.1 SDR family NAD(P)-dependent oxidoreductase [Candidatus Omnitrophota bacterium]